MRTKSNIRVAKKKPEHDLRFTQMEYGQILFCPNDRPGLEFRSGPCWTLERFGYHAYFKGVWIVFHVATRMPLHQFSDPVEAKIKTKRLETGIDKITGIDGTLRGRFDTDHDVPF